MFGFFKSFSDGESALDHPMRIRIPMTSFIFPIADTRFFFTLRTIAQCSHNNNWLDNDSSIRRNTTLKFVRRLLSVKLNDIWLIWMFQPLTHLCILFYIIISSSMSCLNKAALSEIDCRPGPSNSYLTIVRQPFVRENPTSNFYSSFPKYPLNAFDTDSRAWNAHITKASNAVTDCCTKHFRSYAPVPLDNSNYWPVCNCF